MKSWLKFIFLSLFIVIIFGGGPLYLYLYILLFTVLLAQIWAQIALLRMVVERKVAQKGYFVGETIGVTLEVKNTGFLPVLWAYIEEKVPLGLIGQEKKAVVSLAGKTKRVLNYTFRTYERGIYCFNPVKVVTGDILGLYYFQKESFSPEEIIVYPRYKKLIFDQVSINGPNACIKAQISLKADPMAVLGSRDYQKGDPLNHIDWKATARTQSLKTKQIEYRKDLTCAIILNGNLSDYQTQADLEKAIELAASLAKWVLNKKGQVAIYSNGRHKKHLEDRSFPVLGVSANDDKNQFLRILRVLALLNVSNSYPFKTLFDHIRSKLFIGTILLIVTPYLDSETWQRLTQATKKGHQVWIILTRRLKHAKQDEYFQQAKSMGLKIFIAEEKEEVGTIELKLL